jgi:hypothetical protein
LFDNSIAKETVVLFDVWFLWLVPYLVYNMLQSRRGTE